MAFMFCPHGSDGFTWQEVEDCENNVANVPLPFEMPTKVDFEMIDGCGNNDTMLTIEEWAQFVGCQ